MLSVSSTCVLSACGSTTLRLLVMDSRRSRHDASVSLAQCLVYLRRLCMGQRLATAFSLRGAAPFYAVTVDITFTPILDGGWLQPSRRHRRRRTLQECKHLVCCSCDASVSTPCLSLPICCGFVDLVASKTGLKVESKTGFCTPSRFGSTC